MEIPPGFNSNSQQGMVCKLKKALYGLKQSPRAWFGRFTKAMVSMSYRQSQGDHTLFVRRSSSGGVSILLVYVDDIIITGMTLRVLPCQKINWYRSLRLRNLGD